MCICVLMVFDYSHPDDCRMFLWHFELPEIKPIHQVLIVMLGPNETH